MSFDLRHCVSRLVRLRADEQQRGTALQRVCTARERQRNRMAVHHGSFVKPLSACANGAERHSAAATQSRLEPQLRFSDLTRPSASGTFCEWLCDFGLYSPSRCWFLVAEHRPILSFRPQLARRPLPARSASSEMERVLFCRTERG